MSTFFKRKFIKLVEDRVKKKYFNTNTNKSWAVITGSTNGIGKAYSQLLAKVGFNLILISRNGDKLKLMENEINKINPLVNVKSIIIDFKEDVAYDKNNYNKIKEELIGYKINLLINNVGATSLTGNFTNNSFLTNNEQIKVNVVSNIFMTQLILESQNNSLTEDKQNKLGIINISSIFGQRPTPGVSIYSASKAFIKSFSLCLGFELKDYKHIDILCVCPFWVRTGMVRLKKSFFVLEPEDVVYSSLWKIGIIKLTYGNWRHSLLGICFNIIPKRLYGNYFYKYYCELYKRYVNLRNRKNK